MGGFLQHVISNLQTGSAGAVGNDRAPTVALCTVYYSEAFCDLCRHAACFMQINGLLEFLLGC